MTAVVGARNFAIADAGVVFVLLQARYYDGSKGEFLSEDPVFLGDPRQQVLMDPQSLNSYSYANDNPITKSDPTGRICDRRHPRSLRFNAHLADDRRIQRGEAVYRAVYRSGDEPQLVAGPL